MFLLVPCLLSVRTLSGWISKTGSKGIQKKLVRGVETISFLYETCFRHAKRAGSRAGTCLRHLCGTDAEPAPSTNGVGSERVRCPLRTNGLCMVLGWPLCVCYSAVWTPFYKERADEDFARLQVSRSFCLQMSVNFANIACKLCRAWVLPKAVQGDSILLRLGNMEQESWHNAMPQIKTG